jgi:pilus assembly protein CpaC
VKSKESAVVGGVVIKKNSQTFDRNPSETETPTGDGSFLFTFIRSKSFLSDRNQFVVFVTPEIIDSASEGTEEIKKKFRKKGR